MVRELTEGFVKSLPAEVEVYDEGNKFEEAKNRFFAEYSNMCPWIRLYYGSVVTWVKENESKIDPLKLTREELLDAAAYFSGNMDHIRFDPIIDELIDAALKRQCAELIGVDVMLSSAKLLSAIDDEFILNEGKSPRVQPDGPNVANMLEARRLGQVCDIDWEQFCWFVYGRPCLGTDDPN